MWSRRFFLGSAFLLLIHIDFNFANPNNVCTTYGGYFSMSSSKNCYHSPSIFQTVPNIIETYIGKSETHSVTTEDGYILTIFRIPRKNPKGVILMDHTLFTDSSIWVNQDNASTAFVFYRAGYDVWLINNRGTRYSQNHKNLTIEDKQFWDFSFYENGYYDYKAIVDYVREKTGELIISIGHSMGTTSAMIYSSLKPEESKSSIKLMILLSPIAYLRDFTSPVGFICRYLIPIAKFVNTLLGKYSLAANFHSILWQTGRQLGIIFPVKYVYALVLSFVSGWTPHQFDPTYFNLVFSAFPSGFSQKTIYHFSQLMRSNGRFVNYDYGTEDNLKKYGQKTPLEFPVENITTPVYLVHSTSDTVSYPKDVDLLYGRLNPIAKPYGKMKVTEINHVDFHYGRQRFSKIYQPLIAFLNKNF